MRTLHGLQPVLVLRGRTVVLASSAVKSSCAFFPLRLKVELDGGGQQMLTLRAVGRFELLDPTGADHRPNSRKACGVLALLALSPGWRRSRRWLQEKLWSDRGGEQAAASLRQALRDIRRHLGAYRGILRSDRVAVALDAKLLDVSFQLPLRPGPGHREAALFEDLDIADPQFQAWIRLQRRVVSEGIHLPSEKCDRPSRAACCIPIRQTAVLSVTTSSSYHGMGEQMALQASSLASDANRKHGDASFLSSSAPRIASHDLEPNQAVLVNAVVNDLGVLVAIAVTVSDLTSKCILYAKEIRVSGQSSR